MRYPVKPVTLPADLRGIGNGKVPARLLVKIPGGGVLHHRAAAAWVAMRDAAKAAGIELGNVGAYRSYDQQVALFRDRYTTAPTGSKVTRRWNGITYYLRPGKAPSATPGTSNHGWGVAIDIKSIGEGDRLAWLLDNAGRFGFTWEVADPSSPNFEAWHIRFVEGDQPIEGAADSAPRKPGPETKPRVLRQGATGADVALMQRALLAAGYEFRGGADGQFGVATAGALRAFQADRDLTVDGVCGPTTRAALGI